MNVRVSSVTSGPFVSFVSFVVKRSDSPADQHGANRKPGADRRQQHQIALLQAPAAHRVVQRERNRRRRRIAERSMLMITLSGATPSFSVADWIMRRFA